MSHIPVPKMINNIYPSDFGLHIKSGASNNLDLYQKNALKYLIQMKETFKKNKWDMSKEALTKTENLTDKEKEAKDYRDSENIKFLQSFEEKQRRHEGDYRVNTANIVDDKETRGLYNIGPSNSKPSSLIPKRIDDIEINLIKEILDYNNNNEIELPPQLQEYADYLASGRTMEMPEFITTQARRIVPREVISANDPVNIENEINDAQRQVIFDWLNKIKIHVDLSLELANLNRRLTELNRGGKRKSNKRRKYVQRKSNKNKRSNKKRKSNRRKSNKRKSNKLFI
jgi:hypothetical protein